MAHDRLAARREIQRLRRAIPKASSDNQFSQRLDRLEKKVAASVRKKSIRKRHLPQLRYNDELPITVKKDDIINAISEHPVIIVSGETGSGKTTQIPKFCMAAGRGIDGIIGHTQPRRIAAITVAHRIAEELGQEPGRAVGYKIRFKDRTRKDAYLKLMTDGILLAETQTDRYLSAYDTIIVDEAHERSLNIDFILGILQTLLARRRDLKLIITSATIDTEKFSKAFNNAPVIEVSGRMYPVEVRYQPEEASRTENGDLTHVELAVQAVNTLQKKAPWGDILVFMPTEQDIRDTCDLIEAGSSRGACVLPLFARLTAAEQSRVFNRMAQRKIIVATNVAETSLTIPGIKYVIDSGLARISRYSPRSRTTSLPVTAVSRSSADQRKGRCGRVQDGVCIRLYSEADYESRPLFTPPEIVRANLAEVILRMIALKLGDISEFPFIDRPDLKSINDGFNLLYELGAIKRAQKTENRGQRSEVGGQRTEDGGQKTASRGQRTESRGQKTEDGGQRTEDGGQKTASRGQRTEDGGQKAESRGQTTEGGRQRAKGMGHGVKDRAGGVSGVKSPGRPVLTKIGWIMAKIPLDPRLSRMLIEAQSQGCLDDIAVIASALSIQDPRERPAEKTKEADRMHAIFDDPHSDFVTLLNIWNQYHYTWKQVKTNNQMKRFCREHYLSYRRMREWRDIYHQICALLKENGMWNAEEGMRKVEGGRRNGEEGMRNAEGGIRNAEKGNRNGEGGRRKGEEGMRNAEGGIRNAEFGMRKEQSKKATGKKIIGNSENRMSQISDTKFEKIHKSVLSGFLSNIAEKKEKNIFRAAKGKEVMIFPGSGLFDRASNWIVAAEVVETSRVFARTVANIDSAWLEDLGGDLCRRSYLDPHWERNRGAVVALEQVSLFGLIIVADRKVSYGPINPQEATDIFIRSALVDGDVKKPFGFMQLNQGLIDDIQAVEDRIRRRDVLIGEEEMVAFYEQRIGGIHNLKALSRLLKKKGNDRFLRMSKADLLLYRPPEFELSLYPQQIELGAHTFECSYRFEPGENDDGVTVSVPSTLTAQIPSEAMDWVVPGLYREKLATLIKSLPKAYRKKLVPVKDTVEIIAREMEHKQGSLISVLGNFIYRRFGVDIPATAWPLDALPDYLKMRVSVTAPDGSVISAGRDPAILQDHSDETTGLSGFEAVRQKWERNGITRWDFGELPDHVSNTGTPKAGWLAYPALEKSKTDAKGADLRLFLHRHEAIAAHKKGVAELYRIYLSKNLKFLKKRLALPDTSIPKGDYFGGAKRLENSMLERVIEQLFSKNIRSENEFHSHAEVTAPKLLAAAERLQDSVIPVLTAYHETRNTLSGLQQVNPENSAVVVFYGDLLDDLDRLVPDNFINLYEPDRLMHIVRYIKAVGMRAQRAAIDFEKDQAKQKEVHPFSERLNELISTLSQHASAEKRNALEEFFWMLEEFKVSVFAQELKTAFPISKKRLEDKLKQIERMI